MFKLTAAYKRKKAQELEAAKTSKPAKENTDEKASNQPTKKPKRNFTTTKDQLLQKGFKKADTDAMKEDDSSSEGEPNLLPSSHGFDDPWSPGPEYDDIEPSVSFTNMLPRQARPRANRKELWAKHSVELKKWYLESFEIHGHADPCLKQPNTLEDKYKCDCNSKKTNEIYCYMLHSM